jgi:hypothetical protein
MYRLDNDNTDNNEVPSSIEAMEACMDGIMSVLIEPAMKEGKLNDEESLLLGAIATALKEIASRADAYDKISRGELGEDYRN